MHVAMRLIVRSVRTRWIIRKFISPYSRTTIQDFCMYVCEQEVSQSEQATLPPWWCCRRAIYHPRSLKTFSFSLLAPLSTAVSLAEMVLCQMFQRICSCIKNHPLVSVESCAVKRQRLQIRLKGGSGCVWRWDGSRLALRLFTHRTKTYVCMYAVVQEFYIIYFFAEVWKNKEDL